jgi:hypothetical protein
MQSNGNNAPLSYKLAGQPIYGQNVYVDDPAIGMFVVYVPVSTTMYPYHVGPDSTGTINLTTMRSVKSSLLDTIIYIINRPTENPNIALVGVVAMIKAITYVQSRISIQHLLNRFPALRATPRAGPMRVMVATSTAMAQ